MIHETLEISGSHNITGSLLLPLLTETTIKTLGGLAHQNGKTYVCNGTTWLQVAETPGGATRDIEYLVVAGGGGGGGWGGGGGGGGLLTGTLSSVAEGISFTVTVGAGSAGGPLSGNVSAYQQGIDGSSSSVAGTGYTTVTTVGGGGGGKHNGTTAAPGRPGGSGGGAGMSQTGGTLAAGGAGTSGQGYAGGPGGGWSSYYYRGGGGGGASEAGESGNGVAAGGNGGDGLASTITGTSVTYAGGGGSHTDRRGGGGVAAGGSGGGGAGGGYNPMTHAADGTTNTGGGGGGSYGYSTSHQGGGGSGVAVISYNSGSFNCAGGIVGDAGNGRKSNQFNSSGTFKVGSTSNFEIVTDSLYLNLDAGDFSSRGTSTWTDLSGISRNGTVTGATLGTNWYYDFDGSNDRMDFSAADIGGTNFTVEVWVNPDSSQVAYANIFDYDHTGSKGFTIQQANTTTNTYYFYTGGNYNNFTNIPAGTWAHLLISISGTSVVQYLNGVQDGTFTASSNSDTTGERITLASWRAGGSHSRYWNGQYGQCRVYNKALTASEVLQNYNATKTNFI